MKRLIYIVFALASIGFTGSLLLAQHVNLLVGLLGFMFTFFLGAASIENLEEKRLYHRKATKKEVSRDAVTERS